MIKIMDRDEKMKLLLDMQEHPEDFSDEALDAMLADAEAREMLQATALLKQAMAWQEPVEKVKAKSVTFRPLRNMAASFIGVLFLSGIAFAAYWSLKGGTVGDDAAADSDIACQSPSAQTAASQHIPNKQDVQPVVFDNVALDSIANAIAAYHHVGLDLQNERARQLRFYFVWKQDDSLQVVVDKLNMFERVNMSVENGKLIVR